ncbi:glycosyltransferase family 4 protein [Oenococcus oeni]
MKKINFVLPATNNQSIGGYKIIYQYANKLSELGYKVFISFSYRTFPTFKHVFHQRIGRLKHRLTGNGYSREVTWFKINKKVELLFDLIFPEEFPDADIVIATAASTAFIVNELPISKGKKFYFIQNFETWWFDENTDKLNQTFNLGLNNIVISKELRRKVIESGAPEPYYLPNFYDHQEFYLTHKMENRINKVALLNHIQLTKRTKFGLEILSEVKKIVPDLQVELFGAYPAPDKLPDYVNFTYQACPKDLRKIYGESKIYLLPSVLEGWVLTGMEAMASGTMVVSSRIGGITDYANDDNSILITPDNKKEFVDAIVSGLTNDNMRISLSKHALKDVQRYRINESINILKRILNV